MNNKIIYILTIIILIGLFSYLVIDRKKAVDTCINNTGDIKMCEENL